MPNNIKNSKRISDIVSQDVLMITCTQHLEIINRSIYPYFCHVIRNNPITLLSSTGM